MFVAVQVESSHTPHLEPGLRIALGIEFHQLQPVRSDEGHKGDEMLLGHGMVDRDKLLVLHLLNGKHMVFVRFLRFQRRQSDAAAADQGVSGTVDHIAAERTDIKLSSEHIGRNISVDDMLPIHQFNHGDIQCLGQGLKQGNIRQPLGSFPLGDGFAADPDFLGQFLLGQIPCFPKLTDGCACNVGVHRNTSFHPKSTMSS